MIRILAGCPASSPVTLFVFHSSDTGLLAILLTHLAPSLSGPFFLLSLCLTCHMTCFIHMLLLKGELALDLSELALPCHSPSAHPSFSSFVTDFGAYHYLLYVYLFIVCLFPLLTTTTKNIKLHVVRDLVHGLLYLQCLEQCQTHSCRIASPSMCL